MIIMIIKWNSFIAPSCVHTSRNGSVDTHDTLLMWNSMLFILWSFLLNPYYSFISFRQCGPPPLAAHSCLLRIRAFKVLAQIREPWMWRLSTLLQAVCFVLCSEDTLEEEQCCCAVGGLILDVAYGELVNLVFQEWNSKLLLKDLGRYSKWTCTL